MGKGTRIYGSKKGKLFAFFPDEKTSLRKVRVQYYVTADTIESIEGHRLHATQPKEWTFYVGDVPYVIRESKKLRMKLYLNGDANATGMRIAGVWNIPTLHKRPEKIKRNVHRWDFEADKEKQKQLDKYDFVPIWRLKERSLAAAEQPTLVIL